VFVVDTNVLVYAANADCLERLPCRKRLDEWRPGKVPWYVTWPIIYEFLRITTHRKVLKKPFSLEGAWRFVETLAASPAFGVLVETERHEEVAKQTFEELPEMSGNVLHDAHTAILMREHGIRQIYSRDTDFNLFSFLEVLDPLETTAGVQAGETVPGGESTDA